MTPSAPEFLHRLWEVQDILLSFHRHTLPSEFKTAVHTNINLQQSQRPSSEWTIPGDLEGTLLTWGVHDDDCYDFLEKCQPSAIRAILFQEKIRRRLREEISKYDCLPSGHNVRSKVGSIADTLHAIMDAAEFDRAARYPKGDNQESYASLFVEVLEEVCRRHGDKATSGQSRDSEDEDSEASLFHMIIAQPRSEEGPFLLNSLECTPAHILAASGQDLKRISIQLHTLPTPGSYRKRFQKILDKISAV